MIAILIATAEPSTAVHIARDQRIIDAFDAGKSIPEIAVAEEIGPQTVQAALRRAGITYPRGRGASKPNTCPNLADAEWLQHQYATKPVREIAQELGCSEYHVFEALKQAGIPRRTRQERVRWVRGVDPWPVELQECIVALYTAGKRGEQVAEALALKPSAVYEQLREWGITRSISKGRRQKKERKAEKAREGG